MIFVQGLTHQFTAAGPTLGFPDLQAEQGAKLLLCGPSGSGKSTLLALLAGLLTAQSGSVRVGSADLRTLSGRQADAWRGRELGFVPQRLHLSAGLDVYRNLCLPYVAAGQPADRVRIHAVLERLGLGALARRYPHELSLGQAQRVALARAVLRRPMVLLADEPTAHLDDGSAQAALQLLVSLAEEEKATLLVASHDSRVDPVLKATSRWQLGQPQAVPHAMPERA